MNLIDLREKRNRLMHEAAAILQAAEVTAEQRTKAHAILADVDILDVDIATSERIASFEAEQRSLPAQRPNPETPETRSAEQKRAIRSYIQGSPLSEFRDILTTSTTGGALIPQAFAPEIVMAQKAWGGLYNAVRIWKTANGAPMKTSLVNPTGTLMAPTTEGTAPGTNDPTATSILVSTTEITGLIKLSVAEAQDAALDVDQFMRDIFGPGYFRSISNLMVSGSTDGTIQSIVTGYAASAVTTATTGVVAYSDLASVYGALDPAYAVNASWVMNSATRASLIGVTDTLGRPLYIPAPSAEAFDTLIGRPVVLSQYHSSVASTNTPIQFGDLQSGYKLRVVDPGLALRRLDERFADTGEVGFYAVARVGGVCTNAGTPAIVNLQVK